MYISSSCLSVMVLATFLTCLCFYICTFHTCRLQSCILLHAVSGESSMEQNAASSGSGHFSKQCKYEFWVDAKPIGLARNYVDYVELSAVKCPATGLYSDVVNHCQRLWQAEWDGCVLNKLHSVKPLLGYSSLSSLSRQDAVVFRRLRIGHTRLTHSYLLNQQDQSECSHCDCALTVAHVLLKCNHYNVVRLRYFNVSSLHESLDTVNCNKIVGLSP